jgi:cbb3-type cytochrome oxidase subunit 3
LNVYVQFAIAMCFVVFIALFATAYLAVMFNRRAKADLDAALRPLAGVIDGTIDLDEAVVSGSYRGHLAFCRVTSGSDGPGRVFQTDIVDAAGGTDWRWTTTGSKTGEAEPNQEVLPSPDDLSIEMKELLRTGASSIFDTRRAWGRVLYDAAGGILRFERPMQTRRDIPVVETFRKQLELLVQLGPLNRDLQGAPDAEWVGGRRSGTGAESVTGDD